MDRGNPLELTKTTTQLLDALAEPTNDAVWERLDGRFRPVIAGLARRLGLNADAAEEVAQQTLAEFVRVYRAGRYDRGSGRLSSWLLGIARNTALRGLRDQRRGPGAPEVELETVPDPDALRALWDEERDRALLVQGLAALRDESAIDDRTLRAFELVGLRGVPAPAVAAECGMSVEQVYVAKSRVTRRLQDVVGTLTTAFEDDA